ncbi:MAG TPA: aldo/keto reductase [Candidatus Butyricicoccus stercorigallinarum]|nr:aldo/keto reductase [Candidatus Butyricicoccus stercorigallinarum]
MVMDLQTRMPLSNGTSIPCIGFGTWKTPNDEAAASVAEALRVGYRHIDTATAYGNEAGVGQAIAQSGIPRENIFLTSKLWNPHQGYQSTLDAFARSLDKLQTDYLDLYLIHWPHDRKYFDNWEEKNRETWRAFEKLYQDGRIKAIGVSNFRPRHLENLFEHCEIKPMVDQIEIHPGMPQDDMIAYCRAHDMVVEGWSPMATGRIFSVPEVQELAEKYARTVAQIVLRWHVQRGVIPLPKSVTPSRIAENSRLFDFELEPEDMDRISALTDCGWSGLDPDNLVY